MIPSARHCINVAILKKNALLFIYSTCNVKRIQQAAMKLDYIHTVGVVCTNLGFCFSVTFCMCFAGPCAVLVHVPVELQV